MKSSKLVLVTGFEPFGGDEHRDEGAKPATPRPVLADRDQDIVKLMDDSDVLLRALVARRAAVHQLLVSTATFSSELTLLVKQTRADLKPALDNLQGVVNVLLKNQSNLDESLRTMAPFYRYFASTLGNGPWFDTTITNMPPLPGGP